jgi:serine/threonine-protein kinase
MVGFTSPLPPTVRAHGRSRIRAGEQCKLDEPNRRSNAFLGTASAIRYNRAVAEPIAGGTSKAAAERARKLVGRVISDRYRLVELVAMGGMGAIYRGEHLLMRKEVAIKVLHPETEGFPELVVRFEREAVAGAHIQHPNVASASDFGKFEGDSCFLVLEFIKGKTVRQILEHGPIPPARAAHIARQLITALGAAHKKGVVHRDVKPRNVMVVDDGPEDTVKLIDFGLAKVPVAELSTAARESDDPRRSLTQAGVVMGTVAYMAPETALGMGAVGPKADLYAAGVIFYEMLAGKHPFDADDPALLFAQHKNKPPPPIRERSPTVIVPPLIEAVVMRLLSKDPDDRYADADAAVEAIDAATRPPFAIGIGGQGGVHGNDHTPFSVAESVIRVPRRGAMVAAGAAVAAALVLGAVVLLSGRDGPAPAASSSPAAATTTATPAATHTTPRAVATVAPTAAPPAVASAAPAGFRERLHAAASGTDGDAAKVALLDLLERDAGQLTDPAVRKDAAAAAELAGASGDVAGVLEAIVRVEGGLDVLYELVTRDTGASGSASSPARAAAVKARELLSKPDNYARTSPALKLVLELRAAPCNKRVYMLPRAVAEGDERALELLTAMRPPTCGPAGGGCCQKSPDLDKAIEELSAKAK